MDDLAHVDISPKLPHWLQRPFMGGDVVALNRAVPTEPSSKVPFGSLPVGLKEWTVIEDLLFVMAGIDGKYIKFAKHGNVISFEVDESLGESLGGIVRRILPLCADYAEINSYITTHMDFKYGRVVHAMCAAIEQALKDYLVLVAQLEQQLNEGSLTLQHLWLNIQPSMRAMRILREITRAAESKKCIGGQLLNLIHEKAQKSAGDPTAQAMYFYLLQKASVPYWEMLKSWIYKGTIRDPYNEFLIQVNSVERETNKGLSQTFWDEKFTLRRDQVATFLDSVKEKILDTGKYINVFRECGVDLKCTWATNFEYTADERVYIEKVEIAHRISSKKLFEFIMNEHKFMERLRSMKHFFLLDQSDYITHFLDLADDELRKSAIKANVFTLQTQLELAIRSSTLKDDPLAEEISCELLPTSFLEKALNPDIVHSEPPSAQSAFIITTHPGWPLQLIFDAKSLHDYQLLFGFLFYCKHAERNLSIAWKDKQYLRNISYYNDESMVNIRRVFWLVRRSLAAVQSLAHYISQEVCEQEFHKLEINIRKASTVEELRYHHRVFLDECLRRCFIPQPQTTNQLSAKDKHVLLEISRNLHKTLAVSILLSNLMSRLRPSDGADADTVTAGKQLTDIKAKWKAHASAMIDSYNYKVAPTIKRLTDSFSVSFGRVLDLLRANNWAPELLLRLNYNGFYDTLT